jgi:hypothetical protein
MSEDFRETAENECLYCGTSILGLGPAWTLCVSLICSSSSLFSQKYQISHWVFLFSCMDFGHIVYPVLSAKI